jgi:ArsR family transcriptional regulator
MKETVIMNKKYIVQARIFKAMSDENRLKILELIKEKPRSASELLNEMDFGQSTLSHHMKVMLNAEVVQARKNGKWIIYSLKKEAFEEMKEWMDGYL